MPQPFIVDSVISLLREENSFPNLSVLDLSCGEGELLVTCKELGCQVRGSRYRSEDYIIRHDRLVMNPSASSIVIDEGVDLHKALPYENESFDVVILTEVVEHLVEYRTVMYEAARVVKPGGIVIVTTPNIFRLHSRWNFFLFGTHKVINRRLGWDLAPNDLYAYHISPVDVPYLHVLAHHGGLDLEKFKLTRFKWRHAVWLLGYPLFKLLALLYYRGGSRGSVRRAGDDKLRGVMSSFATLFSEQLCFLYRRQ
jgi:SAM-dependent methyltransferase